MAQIVTFQTANWSIEKFEFGDESHWDLATINANAWFRGSSGNDTLTGSIANGTFFGGLGAMTPTSTGSETPTMTSTTRPDP